MAERRIDLRQRMPEWLAVLAADDPVESVRTRAFWDLPPTQRFDLVTLSLSRSEGFDERLPTSFVRNLSATHRRRLVLAALTRTRELVASGPTAEAGLGRLDRIIDWCDKDTTELVAPLVRPHLTLDTTPTSKFAWNVAKRILAIDPNCSLRQPVVDMAIQALQSNEPLLQHRDDFNLPMPREVSIACSFVWPPSVAALALRATQPCGDMQMFAPLLERTKSPKAGDSNSCLAECWGHLVPKLDGNATRELHAAIQERLKERRRPWPAVGYALFATAPDDLLPWFHGWLASAEERYDCAELLDKVGARPPRDRVEFLLEGPGTELRLPFRKGSLFAKYPELVAREWHAAGRPLLRMRDFASLDLIAAGVPRGRVAPVLDFWIGDDPVPLAKLALVAPYPCSGLEIAIANATVGTVASDLGALRLLMTCESTAITRAVTLRALRLGHEGNEFVQDVLASPSTTENQLAGIVAALLEARLAVPDLKQALARLTSAHHQQLVTAAELRFFGRDPTTVGSDLQAIALASLELDVAQLRAVLATTTDPTATLLQSLHLGNAWITPTTLTSALTLAAEVPTEHLPAATAMSATMHPHAAVRAAAYRILHRLDRGKHPEGWLAAEAEFDPDPTVRAVVAK